MKRKEFNVEPFEVVEGECNRGIELTIEFEQMLADSVRGGVEIGPDGDVRRIPDEEATVPPKEEVENEDEVYDWVNRSEEDLVRGLNIQGLRVENVLGRNWTDEMPFHYSITVSMSRNSEWLALRELEDIVNYYVFQLPDRMSVDFWHINTRANNFYGEAVGCDMLFDIVYSEPITADLELDAGIAQTVADTLGEDVRSVIIDLRDGHPSLVAEIEHVEHGGLLFDDGQLNALRRGISEIGTKHDLGTNSVFVQSGNYKDRDILYQS